MGTPKRRTSDRSWLSREATRRVDPGAADQGPSRDLGAFRGSGSTGPWYLGPGALWVLSSDELKSGRRVLSVAVVNILISDSPMISEHRLDIPSDVVRGPFNRVTDSFEGKVQSAPQWLTVRGIDLLLRDRPSGG